MLIIATLHPGSWNHPWLWHFQSARRGRNDNVRRTVSTGRRQRSVSLSACPTTTGHLPPPPPRDICMLISAHYHWLNCTTFKFYSLFINVFTIITNYPEYFQLTLLKIPCSILIILAPKKVFILTSFVVPLDRDVLSIREVYYGTCCLMN